VAGSLGMHIEGVSCPHPDLNDTSTAIEGGLYRVCPRIPGYEQRKRPFARFVKRWIKKHLKPLAPDSDVSVESWLSKTNYSVKRKEELLMKFNRILDVNNPDYVKVKSFIKDEFYPDYKHARTINSRTDEFKTMVGPIFQLIGDQLFSLPYFIKKVSIDKRPQTILSAMRRIQGKVYATDFSSFEAHFVEKLQKDCEFILYEYMTQHLPMGQQFMKWCEAFVGVNQLQFKTFLLEICAKRMSGEMNTSLGNGFTNLMIILYIIWTKNPDAAVEIFVEGDDSIFKTMVDINSDDFVRFGCRVKLEEFTDVCRASFCGMVFDEQDLTNVSDPREVLATFGWTTAKYIRSKKSVHMTLLRCKALSLAYQYPSCPVLSRLAYNVLRLTKSHEVKRFLEKHDDYFNQYEMEILNLANKQGRFLFIEPGIRTRVLVEELYKITIDQQRKFEEYFDNMVEIGPLKGNMFLDIMPPAWIDYYARYSGNVRPKSAIYERPGPLWPKIKERRLGHTT